MIGAEPIAVEYTITHRQGEPFYLEKDGVLFYTAHTVTDAHQAARRNARKQKHQNAGLTEAFGRNRQFTLGPRGGWIRYKGAA